MSQGRPRGASLRPGPPSVCLSLSLSLSISFLPSFCLVFYSFHRIIQSFRQSVCLSASLSFLQYFYQPLINYSDVFLAILLSVLVLSALVCFSAAVCISVSPCLYLCHPTPGTRGCSSLRSSEQGLLFVPFARTSTTQARAFSVVGPSVWNGLPLSQRLLSCRALRALITTTMP